MLYAIDVIIVGPGSVATPIWDKAEADDFSRYRNTDYAEILDRFSKHFIAEGRKGFSPERVGMTVLAALTAARPRVRYAVVPHRFKNWTLPMLLPKRLLDKIISKRLGMVSAGS
jgi:short-subunit dehydrogenase